jgi:predicted transcriptional regulator
MATTIQTIQTTLTKLLDSYSDDLERRGQLKDLQTMTTTLQSYLEQLPAKLLDDVKTDNAQLWQQVLQLKDELEKVKASLRDIHGRLAVREVLAACNEKWIRETARRGNVAFAYLWKNHMFSIRNVAADKT